MASFGTGGLGAGGGEATYQRMVRMAARAFFAGPCPPPDRDADLQVAATQRGKITKADTRLLGVVLLDFMTGQEWTEEDAMAHALNIHVRVLRKALKYLSEEHMVEIYGKRVSLRKKRDMVGDAIKAYVADAKEDSDEDEEDPKKNKSHHKVYYTIDYARAYDAIQLRLHRLRHSLKAQVESSEALQRYRCPAPHCQKEYTSLEALMVLDPTDGKFKCQICDLELVEVLAAGGGPDQQSTRDRKAHAQKLLVAMDRQLAPLTRLMADLQQRGIPPPDHGDLFDWARKQMKLEDEEAARAAKANAPALRGGHAALAADLASSGVTVLAAAAPGSGVAREEEINVQIGGGAGSGAEAKVARVMPTKQPEWFKKPGGVQQAGATGGDSIKQEGGGGGGAGGGANGSSGGTAHPAQAQAQQQAAYFSSFLASIAKLKAERGQQPTGPGMGMGSPTSNPFAPAVKREPGLGHAPGWQQQQAPGLAGVALQAGAQYTQGQGRHPAVKPEPGVPAAGAEAFGMADGDDALEWEDTAVDPMQSLDELGQLLGQDPGGFKQEDGGGGGAGLGLGGSFMADLADEQLGQGAAQEGFGHDADANVEWEDV